MHTGNCAFGMRNALLVMRIAQYIDTELTAVHYADPAPRGGHTGAVPPQLAACPPPNENCAPQARTVPRRN